MAPTAQPSQDKPVWEPPAADTRLAQTVGLAPAV